MGTKQHGAGLAAMTLGALGVVYGDIGTSPLYTLHEIFVPVTGVGVPLDAPHIVGAVSTIFWGLMLVVTLKYVILILRADNNGEGGAMALTALAAHAAGGTPRRRTLIMLVGMFGATLFFGDSVITPAVTVMGAVEGLEVVTPALKTYIVPLSVLILVVLFSAQRFGTGAFGKAFGPILVVWFGLLAVVGGLHVAKAPEILSALNPLYAIEFLLDRGWHVLAALGAIVLALTGAEALYADMGHFGKTPIRLAWSALVLPALALNYMGQGALLIHDPTAIENPFFRLFPSTWVLPMVAFAAVAAVIASQAVISGAFSMTKQAIQLGFLPRMEVVYTSVKEAGQIYLPRVNWVLMVAVVCAVIGFGSVSKLTAAYGIAVTVTMLIDTVLTYFVVRYGWGFPLWIALGATGFFALIDGLLVAACSLKFLHGGWFPLLLALAMFAIMSTWKRGRELLLESIRRDDPDLIPFITALAEDDIPRTPRTAVFTVANVGTVPQALLHNLKHNQVLHETNVILTVKFHEVPWIPFADRVQVEPLARGFWRVTVNYGFKNTPDIPQALTLCRSHGLDVDEFTTSYFLSREVVVPTRGDGMAHWRERLFAAMTRNAGSVVEFFRLPNNSVIELGTRVQI
ncbi:MAG: potassium transporter Kup [Burkholderiales bacterium]|nr:potassium transporter Kup [Burkholderiales bacterium]